MYGDGLRPPLKFPALKPPDLVAGAQVKGNDNRVVTDSGRLFIAEIINLLHNGSIKLFGDTEEVPFDRSIWPFLSLDTPQDVYQFINDDLGWDELSSVDYNFDGMPDSGSTIESGVPYALYEAVDDEARIDYEQIWEEILPQLSSEHSLGEAYLDPSICPVTALGAFALLLDLVRSKRDWIYGMNAIGIDPLNINAEGAVARFEAAFDSPLMQAAGTLNIQGLRIYLGLIYAKTAEIDGEEVTLFEGLIGRYQHLADWIEGGTLSLARDYYRSRVSGMDLSRFESQLEEFRRCISRDRGRVRTVLSGVMDEVARLNTAFGVVYGSISDEVRGINRLLASGDDAALDGILDKLTHMRNEYREMKRHPEAVVNALFHEFATPLDDASFSDTLTDSLSEHFGDALKDSVGYVSSILAMNSTVRTLNKLGQERYERQKDELTEEKIQDAVAEQKSMERSHQIQKQSQSHQTQQKENLQKIAQKNNAGKHDERKNQANNRTATHNPVKQKRG